MKFSNKILFIFLTILFTASNSGLTFAFQYCSMMNEVKESSCKMNSNDKFSYLHSCCEENLDQNEYFNSINCMQLNEVTLSLKEKFLLNKVEFNEKYFIYCTLIAYQEKMTFDLKYFENYFNDTSPPIKFNKYILNSSLLI